MTHSAVSTTERGAVHAHYMDPLDPSPLQMPVLLNPACSNTADAGAGEDHGCKDGHGKATPV